MPRITALLITAALLGPTVMASTPPTSAALASIERLRAGNATFVANPEAALPITGARRAELANGQAPFASVLSCADSRVPPEVVFHTGLGDLFVVRAAGEVADKSVIASLEYAAEHLHSPVIVVMGHESCGAVKAAIETPAGTSLGVNLDYLLRAIRPSVAATASEPATRRLRAAILKNVEGSINDLITHSPMLRTMLDDGDVGVVGAYYELASGRVHFSEPVIRAPGAHK
jgi:carbonic anhydrase